MDGQSRFRLDDGDTGVGDIRPYVEAKLSLIIGIRLQDFGYEVAGFFVGPIVIKPSGQDHFPIAVESPPHPGSSVSAEAEPVEHLVQVRCICRRARGGPVSV